MGHYFLDILYITIHMFLYVQEVLSCFMNQVTYFFMDSPHCRMVLDQRHLWNIQIQIAGFIFIKWTLGPLTIAIWKVFGFGFFLCFWLKHMERGSKAGSECLVESSSWFINDRIRILIRFFRGRGGAVSDPPLICTHTGPISLKN